jgi:hypothetical protein
MTVGESEGTGPHIRNLTLHGGKSTASLCGRFTALKITFIIRCIAEWMAPGVGMDAVERRKISLPRGIVTIPTELFKPIVTASSNSITEVT